MPSPALLLGCCSSNSSLRLGTTQRAWMSKRSKEMLSHHTSTLVQQGPNPGGLSCLHVFGCPLPLSGTSSSQVTLGLSSRYSHKRWIFLWPVLPRNNTPWHFAALLATISVCCAHLVLSLSVPCSGFLLFQAKWTCPVYLCIPNSK
jgi:hypothetical protein